MIRMLAIALSAALSISAAQAATITTTAPGARGMIFVEGEILESDGVRFQEAASRFRHATVSLESNGGNLIGGMAMGRQIRDRGFETMVPNGATCASICASVWLSGVGRSAGGSSRIGFHSSYLVVDGQAQASRAGNELHAKFLRSIDVPETTISYIMMAAPGSMTWMTEDAAKAMGIRYAMLGGNVPAATTTASRGTPTVYRDLRVRAAVFTKPSREVDSCRVLVLADGEMDQHAYVTIDIPRRGGQPAVAFHTTAMYADGQPRTVAADGDVFELAVGSSSADVPAVATGRFVKAMQAGGRVQMVALKPTGETVAYSFGVEGLQTAMQRTAKACPKA